MTPTPEERAREMLADVLRKEGFTASETIIRDGGYVDIAARFALDAIIAAITPAPASDDATVERVATELRVAIQRALLAELGDTYDCTRVWNAWGYGTMGEDDFVPVLDRLEELVSSIASEVTSTLAALSAIPRSCDEPDLEVLGDALFVLSDKLRASHFFEEKSNHDAYERVVQAYLAQAYRPSDEVAKLREALEKAIALWRNRCTDDVNLLWLEKSIAALADGAKTNG